MSAHRVIVAALLALGPGLGQSEAQTFPQVAPDSDARGPEAAVGVTARRGVK
jgi:hypothetical protein